MNPKHSSATVEHFTPSAIVEFARELMTSIDLDPASCAEANATVKATHFLTREGDALGAKPWCAEGDSLTVFLNPPGGRLGGKSGPSMQRLFWERLTREWESGGVAQAVFLAFSLEALQTTSGSPLPMTRFPMCIPQKRIRFMRPDGSPGTSPTHASAIVYLPPRGASKPMVPARRFANLFAPIGPVLVPAGYAR